MLIDDAIITNGTVIMELSWEGYADTFLAGSSTFLPNGEKRVPYPDLATLSCPFQI